MRIAREWNHNDIKVTVFVMNGRYSVKLEKAILEQWYKFRDGQVDSLDTLVTVLDDRFYDKAESLFSEMARNRADLIKPLETSQGFDTII